MTQLDYNKSLPSFMTMQRISFCWFLADGLSDELQLFSKVFDFSRNAEYVLYGKEYGLVKPICNLSAAQRYSGNYRTQVVLPIEMRDKKTDMVYHQEKFPLVTLPLMTTSSTFLLNGCERVIVSQIIRSPGIYFEKLKNQTLQKPFIRKISTDITKLREFLPSGQASLSSNDLFFTVPTDPSKLAKDENNEHNEDERAIKYVPRWTESDLFNYSLYSFKTKQNKSNLRLLLGFTLYQKLLQKSNSQSNFNSKLPLFFSQWVYSLIKNSFISKKISIHTKRYLLTYFHLLNHIVNYYNFSNFENSLKLEKFKLIEKNIFSRTFQFLQLNLNKNFLLITEPPSYVPLNLQNFYLLKQNIKFTKKKINTNFFPGTPFNFVPSISFSNTFKDQMRYIYMPTKKRLNSLPSKRKLDKNQHMYVKTKTRIISFNEDHKIKTLYNRKYDEKELYNATLIPEYGSWIRFAFQKNLKLYSYGYPVKNYEENIIIQLDKINQKPVLSLLREIGLTNLEIYQNLQHRDFFYFTKPLLVNALRRTEPVLRFHLSSTYFRKLSEFSRVFNSTYYTLGYIGRSHINKRLNIDIDERYQTITYEDIFAITDKLITLTLSKTLSDDIDHLKNRRVRSIGELVQNLVKIGFQRLIRILESDTNKSESRRKWVNFNLVNGTIKEFFSSSQLSQYLDQTNPLSSLTHRRRISSLGPGGLDRDHVSFSVRDIHPSHYGRICPIETPEGQNVGLISSLTTCARVNDLGFLETPFWRVSNGKILKKATPIYLTADTEDLYKIAPGDLIINENNYLMQNSIAVRYQQDFINVEPHDIDFISISTIQVFSIGASLIPFFEHDDANRALMGSNMQRQSVPLLLPQKPIVGTGLENQVAIDSGATLVAHVSGIVHYVSSTKISIKNVKGQKTSYIPNKYLRSNQQTCINQRPIVWKGEFIQKGQILTDGPAISSNELALGQNVLVGYMPWQGYNFEDAILISERLVYEDIFTSVHIERHKVEIDHAAETFSETTKNIPNLSFSETENLNDDGIVQVGTFIQPGDILVGKVIENENLEQLPESKLLRAIFGAQSKGVEDNSYRMPIKGYGRVVETITFNRRTRFSYRIEKIYIFIAQVRKIQVGDKIAGRHGNKGIISRILPRQDMPFLPDGTPIDIILNPLGVPSRMNVGQLYECLLGLAGDRLNCRFKILPFDEMYGIEMSRILINKKLRQASIANNQGWLFNPYAPGKMVLIDGRTGKEFENPITVGNAYMLKLIHLVDDKMHARATGPYSLITQQPLRGKAQQGGQRFGEMEVWALEGFGAAFTLKELLTIKSDDMKGRNKTLSAIVKGDPITEFGIPESFKVLLQELRSMGLDMSTYKLEKFSSSENFQVEVHLIDGYNTVLKTFPPESDKNDISF